MKTCLPIIFLLGLSLHQNALGASAASFLKPLHNRDKVSEGGLYKTFPGLTIVSPLSDEQKSAFNALYQGLQSIPQLTDYYALLPVESYHVTTLNLFTNRESGGQWRQFIAQKNKKLSTLKESLSQSPITPTISINTIRIGRAISIVLEIDSESNSSITRLADESNLSEKIPPFFHITLAYLYKEIPVETLNEIKEALLRNLEMFLSRAPVLKQLTIKESRICYFTDMKAFIPWSDFSREIPLYNLPTD